MVHAHTKGLLVVMLSATSTLLPSCSDLPVPADGGACAPVDGLFVASDASSNGFGAFARSGATSMATGVDLGKDPAFASSKGRAFFVARDLDTIVEMVATCGTAKTKTSVAEPGRVGSTNPQDVAVANDGALWVPRYNVPSVLVLGPGNARKTIDLSGQDDDGNPNMASIHLATVGGVEKAFVALQRLDDRSGYASVKPSKIVRIDVARGEIDSETTLAGRNPFTLVVPWDGGLWFGTIGNVSSANEVDAGVERFDPGAGTSRLVVTEANLGGSVIAIALAEGCGVAIVADARTDVNATSVVTFDPRTGTVLRNTSNAVYGPTAGYDLWTASWSGDTLFVGDRRRQDRGFPIHTFRRTESCTLTPETDAIFVAQKPVAIRTLPLAP
ncbi:MAG: hypothetical protein U0169_23655 [Polyangiaceae bacterium]